jgi:hypothetical protein
MEMLRDSQCLSPLSAVSASASIPRDVSVAIAHGSRCRGQETVKDGWQETVKDGWQETVKDGWQETVKDGWQGRLTRTRMAQEQEKV